MADEINEKMEQIRLKNEELEKKHKEILQDELEAKKQGATVQKSQAISCKTTEKHRYDNVDLDYDVKDEQKELSKNPDYKPKNRRPILGKKQIDEIPSDPINFLRDDGDEEAKPENTQSRRPAQNTHHHNRNRNRNPRPRNAEGESEEKSAEGGPPRQQRTQNHRPRPHHNNRNNSNDEQQSAVNNRDSTGNSPRKTHPQQLRERRTVQSTESTDDSTSEPIRSHAPHHRPKRPSNNNDRTRARPNREKIDGKNDITVEVNDEVRSVKLKSGEKKIGSGRVKTENLDGTEGGEDTSRSQEQNARRHNRPHHHQSRNRKPRPPQAEFQHPILDKIVITKTSVQDRLMRSKMMDDDEKPEPTEAVENANV